MDFPDAPATDSTDAYAAQLAPAADWMGSASYGRSQLAISPVHRWIRMPADSTSYGFARGLTFETHEKYVATRSPPPTPTRTSPRTTWSMSYPRQAAAAIPFSPTYLYDPTTPGVTADGTRLKWAVTFGQDMWRWGYKVAAHETAHTFGLPDLYSFTGPTHQYAGGWDVMGNIAGPAPQYLGWHSWKLGWTRDNQVACLPGPGRRTVRLTPVERPGGTKIAVLRTGETTAYVAESRRATGQRPGRLLHRRAHLQGRFRRPDRRGTGQDHERQPDRHPARRLHPAGPGRLRARPDLHRPGHRSPDRCPHGRPGRGRGAAQQDVKAMAC